MFNSNSIEDNVDNIIKEVVNIIKNDINIKGRIDNLFRDQDFLQLKNNIEYKGDLKNGKLSGPGVMKFPDGTIIKGFFKENKLNGAGFIEYINGNTYEGEMKNGKPNGKGEMKYQNGLVYIGQVKNGQPNGDGTMHHKNGAYQKGKFENGYPYGEIETRTNSGTIRTITIDKNHYNKNIVKDRTNDSTISSKDWESLKPKNETAYSSKSTRNSDGETEDGDNKKIINYSKDGKVVSTYTGSVQNGQPNGKGVIEYKNVGYYKGEFKNGLPHGDGEMKYQNGRVDIGNWNNGAVVKQSFQNKISNAISDLMNIFRK